MRNSDFLPERVYFDPHASPSGVLFVHSWGVVLWLPVIRTGGIVRDVDEVKWAAFTEQWDGVIQAGIILGTTVLWPMGWLTGHSPSLLAKAMRAGLPSVSTFSEEVWEQDTLDGWVAELDEREPLTVRIASPADPAWVYGLKLDAPPGWFAALESTGRVLLLVTDVFDDRLTSDFEETTAARAAHGRLAGGMIQFVQAGTAPRRSASRDAAPREASETRGRFTVFHDPVSGFSELAMLVKDGVLTFAQASDRVCGNMNALRDVPELGEWLSDEALLVQLFGGRNPLDLENAAEHIYWYTRLVTAVGDSRGGPEHSALWLPAASQNVLAATAVLSARHDSDIFRDADELAVHVVDYQRRHGRPEQLASALIDAARLRLALLGHLELAGDMYAALNPSLMSCRQAECLAEYYCEAQSEHSSPLRAWPSLISEADGWLAEAADLGESGLRGRALASRTQTQYWLNNIDAALPPDSIWDMLRDAYEHIDLESDLPAWLHLLRLIHLRQPLPSDIVQLPFERSCQETLDAFGEATTRAVISQGIEAAKLLGDRPLLKRVLAWSNEMPEPVADAHARQALEASLHCLPDDRTSCPGRDASLDALVVQYGKQARNERWTDSQLEEAQLHLAAHALAEGRPDLGIILLTQTQLTEERVGCWTLLSADLHYQAGETGIVVPPYPAAPFHLLQAAVSYATIGQFSVSRLCLDELRVRLAACDHEILMHIVGAIAIGMPSLHTMRDLGLTVAARDLTHTALLRIADYPLTHPDIELALHHAAKGADFYSYAERGQLAFPAAVAHEMTLLRNISDSSGQDTNPFTAEDESWPSAGDPDGSMSFTMPGETSTASMATAIEQNLRRHIDQMINNSLASPELDTSSTEMVWDEIQNRVDDQTILISWFMPATPGAEQTYTVMAITREQFTSALVLVDDHVASAVPPEGLRHYLTNTVTQVRQAVTDDPLFHDVTPEGAQLLARNAVFANLAEQLPQWRATGKTRLVLWPHGPLHHLPFHLYSIGGRLIADDFIVTTIPTLAALRPSDAALRPPRFAVLASAEGGEPFGLPREEILNEHAADVASATGTTAITGPAATRERLLAELATADVIHIAAHGVQDVAAPWFGCLYLSADDEDDGRVFAHDILTADLRGVRLVTLAACESALGSFDVNDNPRGLTAGFLLAGAEAIVACLWPVHPEPATHFFSTLHSLIAEGNELEQAFHRAQANCRSVYPHYRDWGAFTFIQGRSRPPHGGSS
ncbi:CHAT domain-containing protein [Streptomyces sp. NPDC050759]|uniref:CHAT domain-containing protein n=1 Tax=Streptomyces sp. NPDC050759 TaxID=3365635 RepID=UPI00379BC62A